VPSIGRPPPGHASANLNIDINSRSAWKREAVPCAATGQTAATAADPLMTSRRLNVGLAVRRNTPIADVGEQGLQVPRRDHMLARYVNSRLCVQLTMMVA
jgi:hypothetical protein